MKNLVAAKILMQGMCDSFRKRDNKTLSEIITSVETESKAAMITKQELVDASSLSLSQILADRG